MMFGKISNETVIACATKGTDRIHKEACEEAAKRNLYVTESCRVRSVSTPNPRLAMNEDAIMELYRSGDEILMQEAKDQILLKFGRYVGSIIHSLFPSYEANHGQDLYNSGCIGLIKAMENFNENGKYRFTTYSKTFIIHEMSAYARFLTNQPTPHYVRLQARVKNAHDALMARGVAPSTEDIAKEADMTVSAVKKELDAMTCTNFIYIDADGAQNTLNLNTKNVTDEVDERLDRNSLLERVATALDVLDADTKKIIIMHGAYEKTYDEISEDMGIKKAIVKSMYKKGVERVRHMSKAYALGA